MSHLEGVRRSDGVGAAAAAPAKPVRPSAAEPAKPARKVRRVSSMFFSPRKSGRTVRTGFLLCPRFPSDRLYGLFRVEVCQGTYPGILTRVSRTAGCPRLLPASPSPCFSLPSPYADDRSRPKAQIDQNFICCFVYLSTPVSVLLLLFCPPSSCRQPFLCGLARVSGVFSFVGPLKCTNQQTSEYGGDDSACR